MKTIIRFNFLRFCIGFAFVVINGFTNNSVAQENIFDDTLLVRNYSSSTYKASPFNLAGATLKDNTLLIANDNGILSYNGSDWTLTSLTGDARATSIKLFDSLILVGGYNEFGYLERTKDAHYEYHSLRSQLDDSVKVSEVYYIVPFDDNVYFQTYANIFRWDGKNVYKIPLKNSHITKIGDKLIASQYNGKLYRIEKDSVYSINNKFLFEEDAIFNAFPTYDPDEYLIATSDSGFYTFDYNDYTINPWKTEVTEIFKKQGFYSGISWLDSLYAATTWDGAVVIYNKKGEVRKIIDKSDGLTGKYLTELFVDNRNKLWINSDVGISELYWPSFDTLSYVNININKVFINDQPYTAENIVDSLFNENSNFKFSYFAPGFEKEEILYSYKLVGQDEEWSDWKPENTKEYNFLKGGDYSFLLRAKTITGLESETISINIKTSTPWFKTIWAYLSYAIIVLGIIILIFRLRTLRLKDLNKILESTVTARTEEINAKKEELTLANENLNIKNQELDHFVYRSSHDLIAPLKSLKGLIHIAKSDQPQKNQLEYLKHMEKSVLKLEDFINSIIEFTTNAKTEAQRVDIKLDEILDDISQELKYFDKAEKVELIRDLEEPIVVSDPKRLKIILSNLISNSVKYHNYRQENPFIEVKSYGKNGQVFIEVKDNGQGIKPELVDKIFDMFYRASDSSDGSGLGLYIVQDTVAKINGELTVKSNYGEGSVFTLMLDR